MNGFDFLVIALLIGSSLLGLMRGLVREVLAIAAWIFIAFVMLRFGTVLEPLLPEFVSYPLARTGLALVFTFLILSLAVSLVTWLLGRLIASGGLSGGDRTLGGAFGLVRGMLILVIITTVIGASPLSQTRWWRDSLSAPYLQQLYFFAEPLLPDGLTERVSF